MSAGRSLSNSLTFLRLLMVTLELTDKEDI
jgi:hypothetical protein